MKKMVKVPSERNEAGKQKYQSPQLVCYGTITKLTKGTGIHGNDGAGSLTKNPCWIAEVIYGVDAPRTQLVRAWLNDCYEQRVPWSLVVVPLYCRFGQRTARLLHSIPVFKNLFRPLFDLGVRRAHRDLAATLLAVDASTNAV
jgi:hypothetical protein